MQAQSTLQKVKRDYNAIAEYFSETRDRSWPEFAQFIKLMKLPKAKKYQPKVLDAGCGNGRMVDFFKQKNLNIDYTGVDNNKKLLAIAKRKHPRIKFQHGDILKLPFPDKSFDSVWCIATLHHIPTSKLQLKALKEFKRVMMKSGYLALTVWNLWQPKYKKYINRKTHEALILWSRGKTVQRFYYAFKYPVLRALLKKTGFSVIKRIKNKHNISIMCYEKS